MAVVGEAHILVRAVTTHVRKDIRDGFKGLSGVATDEGKSVGKAFSGGLSQEMMANANQFTSLARKGYFAQSAIGALLGSVSALAGGLGGLIGVTASAASSMTVMANMMVTMKVASSVGKMAFNGISAAVSNAANSAGGAKKSIKELREEMEDLAFAAEEAALSQESAALKLEKARETLARVQNLPPDNRARREAELAYKQAELNYRKAKDKAEDAQDELNNPKKKAGAGGKDPFADLTKSQKVFAMFLVENRYRMKQLREAAAKGFLPVLQKQMQTLFNNGAFDNLVDGIANVGRGLGEATKNFSKSFFTEDTINGMSEFFSSIAKNLGTIGTTAGNALRGFFTYLKLTDPLLTKFTNFLNRKTDKFAADMVNNGGAIQIFFGRSSEYASKFGEIFGNLWLRIKQFISNTTGPGSGGELLVNYFVRATGEFKKMDGSIRAFNAQNYFRSTAENTIAILNAFKGVFDIFTDLGTMPEVKEFWDILSEGNNNFSSLLKAAVRTAPALARVVNQLTNILQVVVDDNQTSAFLDTLAEGLRVFARALQNLKPLLDAVGPIFGFLAALGLLQKAVQFLAFAIVGLLIKNAIAPFLIMLRFIPATAGFAGKALVGLGVQSRIAGIAMATTTTTVGGVATAVTGLQATTAVASKGITASLLSIPGVGWALGLAAAFAAIGIALSNWSAGVADQNMKETIGLAKNTRTSFKALFNDAKKTNWSSILGNGGAGKEFTLLTLEVTDLKTAMGQLGEAQDRAANGWGWVNAFNGYSDLTQDMAGSFERFGAGLNERFSTQGLSGVRKGLTYLTDNLKLNGKESITAYKEMDTLRATVQEYGKSLGVTLTNLDGTADAQKEYDFIMKESIETNAIAKIKQDQFNQTLTDTIGTFFDFEGPLRQNKEDVKNWAISVAKNNDIAGDSWKDYYKDFDTSGFSSGYYFDALNKQANSAADYAKNLMAAKEKLSEKAFNQLLNMGKGGVKYAEAIASATKQEAAEVNNDLEKIANFKGGNFAGQIAAQFDRKVIIAAIRKQNPNMSRAMESLIASLDPASLMERFGIGFEDLMAVELKTTPMELTANWKPDTAANLQKELATSMNKLPLYISTKKDGGVVGIGTGTGVGRGTGVGARKDGGWLPKFANGAIAGAQGPRSDNILSMLSAGEYVINAASTYRYRPLLDAINSGSIDRLQNTANMQSAAGNNVSITVNAAPGMDESQVASMVAQKLNSALNMGARI